MNAQAQAQANAQETKMSKANAAKSAKIAPVQGAQVQDAPIVPVVQETAAQAANVPFPTILYPRLDAQGQPRSKAPYIRNEDRTLFAKIGSVEISMVVPEGDAISVHDVVTCKTTKVSNTYNSKTKSYCIDELEFQVPAIIFFANGLAGMAERLNTNSENREAFEGLLQAWKGGYPMAQDQRAMEKKTYVPFSWAYLLTTYEPTPEQAAGWAVLKSMTTTELNALTVSLRSNYLWIKEITDAAGYVEPVKKAVPDALALALGAKS